MSANDRWVWITREVFLAVHEEQLSEHGGGVGMRDPGLLESALARPSNTAACGEPSAAGLAAAYAFAIARNHPFVDGNKRTAFVAMELFLALNGWELQADDADCVLTCLKLAAGELGEETLSAWIAERLVRGPA